METETGSRNPTGNLAGNEEMEDGDDDISDKLVIDCDGARTPETAVPSEMSSEGNVQKSGKAEKAPATCSKGPRVLESSGSQNRTSLGSRSNADRTQLSPSMSFNSEPELRCSAAVGSVVQGSACSFDETSSSKAGNGLRMKIKMKKMATRQSAARHEVVSLDVDASSNRGGKRKTGTRKRVMNRSPSGTSFAVSERSTLQRLKKPRRSSRCSNKRVSSAAVPTENGQYKATEPGTAVVLEGVLWKETSDGILVVNVTWRGKSYVGTLLDLTQYNWSPPRQSESPAVEQNGPRGGVGAGRGGRCTRRGSTLQRSVTVSNRNSDGPPVSLNEKLPWMSESKKSNAGSLIAAAVTEERPAVIGDHSLTAHTDDLPSAPDSLSDQAGGGSETFEKKLGSYVEDKKENDQQFATQEGNTRRVTLADLARVAITLESKANKAQPWSLNAKPFSKLSAEEAESLDNLFRVVNSGQSATGSQPTEMGQSVESDCLNTAGDGCSQGEEEAKPGPTESMRSLMGADGPLDISDDESDLAVSTEWKQLCPSVSTDAGNSYPLGNGLFMNFIPGGLMPDPGVVNNGTTVMDRDADVFDGQVGLRNENPLNMAYPAPSFMNNGHTGPSTSAKGGSPIGTVAAHSVNRLPPPAFVYEPMIPTYFGIPKVMFPYPAGCLFALPPGASHQQMFSDGGIIPAGYNMEYRGPSCLDAAGCSTAASTGAHTNGVLPIHHSVCTPAFAAATESLPMESCPDSVASHENE